MKKLTGMFSFILVASCLVAYQKGEKKTVSEGVKNYDYEELVDFPARTEENTCSHTVEYLVYYISEGANAVYSNVEIQKFTYEFYEETNKVTIAFDFECYIDYLTEASEYFAFEIVAYSRDDVRLKTEHVFEEGDEGETVRVQSSITLNKIDILNGIVIEFLD